MDGAAEDADIGDAMENERSSLFLDPEVTLSLGGTGGADSSDGNSFDLVLLGEWLAILRESNWFERVVVRGSRLDFLGGCCWLLNVGEAISRRGLMTSSAPGPPPNSLNCSMIL